MTVLVADEVALAIAGGHPVVALETSVIGQGLPQPRNLECVARMSAAIRDRDAVPAWIAVIDGALLAGLDDAQLERVATSGEAVKVARRDLPVAVARGDLGATTVSATIWAASRAGIEVTATGGIGGVHTGDRRDVSADLDELAHTPGLLVCSGPKSIVDPVATLERLEELGVVVVGYGVDRLPFFLAREAPVELEHRVDTPGEAAAILAAQARLRIASTIVLCNPVPERSALDADEVRLATARAEVRMEAEGVKGKAVTPYLLAAVAQETDARSLTANLDLLESNAALAAEIAARCDPAVT